MRTCRVCGKSCTGRVCRACYTTKNNKWAGRYEKKKAQYKVAKTGELVDCPW